MLIRDSKEYGTMILNGVEYNSIFNNGIEYGFTSSDNFRPRTQSIIDYATVNGYSLPTDLGAYNTLIGELEDSGVLAKLDLFYCFFGDSDSNFKTINIVDPDVYKGVVGSTVGNALDGLKGGGSSSGIISTTYLPENYTGNYQHLNACRGYFLSDRTGVDNFATGAIDGTQQTLYRQGMSVWSDDRQRINGSTNRLSALPDILNDATFGVVTLSRTSASDVNIVVVGSGTSNFTQAASQGTVIQQLIFRNSNVYGISRLGGYFIGASLNETEATYIDTALKNYYNTLTA